MQGSGCVRLLDGFSGAGGGEQAPASMAMAIIVACRMGLRVSGLGEILLSINDKRDAPSARPSLFITID